MNDLERIRNEAVGQEVDEALMKQYPIKEQKELEIPTRHGFVKAYLYRPYSDNENLPLMVNFHGGGFVKGYRGRDFAFSRILATGCECMVLDVDYKTAPEYKYPYAIEEGYDLICYIYSHGAEWNVNCDLIALSGQSAGANIVTAITFLLKENRKMLPKFVSASYPPYDLFKDPADKWKEDSEEARKSFETGRLYNDWYIEKERRKELYASPVYADLSQLKGLPHFLIICGEEDPLNKEAMEFAKMLMEANVTVTFKRVPGAKHGFLVRRGPGYDVAEQLISAAAKQCWQEG